MEFLVDTGATVTLVSKLAIEKIGPITSDEPFKPEMLSADGTHLKVYRTQLLEFSLQGAKFTQKIVVADLNVDGILGLALPDGLDKRQPENDKGGKTYYL